MAVVVYKDKIVKDVLSTFDSILTAYVWYRISGYCAFVQKHPIISPKVFVDLETYVLCHWSSLDAVKQHAHKNITTACVSSFNTQERLKFFDVINSSLKSTADMHIKQVYGEDVIEMKRVTSSMAQTTPMSTIVVNKNNTPSRIHVSGKIWLQISPKLDQKQIDTYQGLADKYGFSYYSGSLFTVTCPTRAKTSGAVLQLLNKLIANKAHIREYSIHEVLVDSNIKDVWNLLKK